MKMRYICGEHCWYLYCFKVWLKSSFVVWCPLRLRSERSGGITLKPPSLLWQTYGSCTQDSHSDRAVHLRSLFLRIAHHKISNRGCSLYLPRVTREIFFFETLQLEDRRLFLTVISFCCGGRNIKDPLFKWKSTCKVKYFPWKSSEVEYKENGATHEKVLSTFHHWPTYSATLSFFPWHDLISKWQCFC